jgi:hypothetical protein
MLPKDPTGSLQTPKNIVNHRSSLETPYSIPTLNGRLNGSAETTFLSKEQQFAAYYIKCKFYDELNVMEPI